MQLNTLLAMVWALVLSKANAEEQGDYSIIGSVIWGRHNDRQAKPATYLTPVGAESQYEIGQFYRRRYFGLDSSNNKIDGVNTTIDGLDEEGYYVNGQIYTETTQSSILLASHYAFLQGLYPPMDIDTKSELYNETLVALANGSAVQNPLDGYQYVVTNIQQNATDGYIWTQGDQNCPALNKASKKVKNSEHFYTPGNQSAEFFQSLYQIDFIKETFALEELTFANSMNIYDQVTVNTIHNSSVAKQINESTYKQIQYWSDLYQWTLSDKTINANLTIGAQTLVGRIVSKLNTTLTTGEPYLTYMTGAFSVMYQLSSLLDLYTQDARFKTMPSYGATYVFELLSDNASDDKFVRFSFKNGTDEMGDGITSYPLFNTSSILMSWDDFVSNAKEVDLSKVSGWCSACGYDALEEGTLDMCVPSSDLYETALSLENAGVDLSSVSTSDKSGGSSLSLADAGGIGAGTTIGVFLILGGLFYLYKKLSTKKSGGPILPVTASDESTHAASTIGKE